jgi:hypothetical protein
MRTALLKRLAWMAPVSLVLVANPAAAQFFGNIFGGPPRPPADVPGRQPSYPVDPRLPVDPPPDYRPPYDRREDAPQPPPPPLTRLPPGTAPAAYPPGSAPADRPQGGGVTQQPLPPPPGTVPPTEATVAPPNGKGPLPGLPPGQRQPRGEPGGAGPTDEVVVEPPTQKIVNPTAVFAGLDKITGRIISFDVAINETVQFGALRLTPRACYTRPPTEAPNTDGFVEVDEITLQGEVKRIFTGWMFAASPGLHAVEHPIYDVWLTDCKQTPPSVAGVPGQQAAEHIAPAATPAAAAPAAKPAPAAAPQPPPRLRR